jgi:hypothetical protein
VFSYWELFNFFPLQILSYAICRLVYLSLPKEASIISPGDTTIILVLVCQGGYVRF